MKNTKDIGLKFEQLCQKALDCGITGEQLATLDAIKQLQACKNNASFFNFEFRHAFSKISWRWPKYALYLLCTCLMAIFLTFLLSWPVKRKELVASYLDLYHLDVERERCLIDMPETVVDVSRPPINCEICKDITNIMRYKNVSPEEFEDKFAYSGIPVIITDAMENWTASTVFSFSFFKSIYADDSPVLLHSEDHCQFFPYKTKFRSLSEVFNMSEERAQMKDGSEPWYIGWSNCDSSAANVLRQHYNLPYFLPAEAESSKTDWIFMGSPGYGAHMHIDHVGKPSWQAQISGVKKWTLEPPPECYFTCTSPITVTVYPGEIIVLDTNIWYHATMIIGNEMSITIGSEYD